VHRGELREAVDEGGFAAEEHAFDVHRHDAIEILLEAAIGAHRSVDQRCDLAVSRHIR
jgi:hypothetical protein